MLKRPTLGYYNSSHDTRPYRRLIQIGSHVGEEKNPCSSEVCQERPTESTYVSDSVEQAGIWPRTRELQLDEADRQWMDER